MTTTETLEVRVAQLEDKVAKLTGEATQNKPETPWWKRLVGVYKDDPEFDEAERLGREWRQSDSPKDDEDAA
jgi:hypothetical protein